MPDDLRAWLEQVRDERNRAQVALQNGDPAPMKQWALEYGHLLVAKCEELADELHHAIDHHIVRGDNLTICVECGHRNKHAQGCWVGEAEKALRVPGGGERG